MTTMYMLWKKYRGSIWQGENIQSIPYKKWWDLFNMLCFEFEWFNLMRVHKSKSIKWNKIYFSNIRLRDVQRYSKLIHTCTLGSSNNITIIWSYSFSYDHKMAQNVTFSLGCLCCQCLSLSLGINNLIYCMFPLACGTEDVSDLQSLEFSIYVFGVW